MSKKNPNLTAEQNSIHTLYKHFTKSQFVPQSHELFPAVGAKGEEEQEQNKDDNSAQQYDFLKLKQQYYKSFRNGVALNANFTMSCTKQSNNDSMMAFRVSKDDIKDFRYIGQFDMKFLICAIAQENVDSKSKKKSASPTGLIGNKSSC